MAWMYADWNQQTSTAAQLARLELHITEVANKISRDVNADGFGSATGAVQTYYDSLVKERARLQRLPGANGAVGGGFSLARLS